MNKKRIPKMELRMIFDWASMASNNDEFWGRVQLASAAYSPTVQSNVARLVALATEPSQPNNPVAGDG